MIIYVHLQRIEVGRWKHSSQLDQHGQTFSRIRPCFDRFGRIERHRQNEYHQPSSQSTLDEHIQERAVHLAKSTKKTFFINKKNEKKKSQRSKMILNFSIQNEYLLQY